MVSKLKRFLPLLMLILFVLALVSVYRQLHGYQWHDLLVHMRQIPFSQVGLALVLTAAAYLVMTGYDFLALRYIRHPLATGKIALVSFLGYAFSNNVGFSMLAGASKSTRLGDCRP